MKVRSSFRRRVLCVVFAGMAILASGCQWRGLNSLPLPGTAGGGPGSFEITAELPDVTTIERNSRVRVGDVTIGNVTRIERQGWHAVLTLRLDGNVNLPENATAKVGQSSLLGSQHVELAAPTGVRAYGKLGPGSVIRLSSASAYPSTEQILSAISLLLNGGGIGQLQDITEALGGALSGERAGRMRELLSRINTFVTRLNGQTEDVIRAVSSLNGLVGQLAQQKPVVDEALRTVPEALAVLSDERGKLVEAFDQLGKFAAVAAASTDRTKESLIAELKDIGPVLESFANAGPALTRSMSILATFPFPKETIGKSCRGDYCNQTLLIDLTLNRLDTDVLTGTRLEGKLTELEMQWGRTIGQLPSPHTAGNPLVVPYHPDQTPPS
ncbi:virulence factor Mce family protein [Mycobacteroides abscessus subsp. bolletii]|nr:virulence factor Mce family protein [Mycobacteroides abscessus subsp. bolletii]SKF64471.1 virulence factor Mce family protein [Mycobacteroides abscessus subsp. bolletii]SKF84943.1 virulence factor Mce family protein [Mycobacteroides abscessus subsp. bolletii]SKG19013.1 virulence factor Mce family protein [Mycobacteroides abscessus subsp. bolletii]SKG37810.1 virulence factor Mce family protein [Mycobacteroides abscessus subsp. bolletii]